MHIKIKQGLDIPIAGGPTENTVKPLDRPKQIGFSFLHFDDRRFHLRVRQGEEVKIGDPLVHDKECPERFFASPAGGTIAEIQRGEKRRLQGMVITVSPQEEWACFDVKNPETLSRQAICSLLAQAGLFTQIRSRPFNLLASPKQTPRSIFVRAIESAPFQPSAEMQVSDKEREFQMGLRILKKLTDGHVHLVYREGSPCRAFTEAEGVEKHTVSGPHPAANVSVHIHNIDPIRTSNDIVWTTSVLDVIACGSLFLHGKVGLDHIISIAGEAILPSKRGFYRARLGASIAELIADKIDSQRPCRLISGDLLTGDKVLHSDFLQPTHHSLAAIFETEEREFASFFRLGAKKYSASGAYMSGHMNAAKRRWSFTTSQHGEQRACIDGTVYARVMPMNILPLQLIRAILAEDYELAEEYGLLEVDPEDFALPEFVDPSKMPLMEIVKQGIDAITPH